MPLSPSFQRNSNRYFKDQERIKEVMHLQEEQSLTKSFGYPSYLASFDEEVSSKFANSKKSNHFQKKAGSRTSLNKTVEYSRIKRVIEEEDETEIGESIK